MTGFKKPNDKHLMFFAGRAFPELADEVAEPDGRRHRADPGDQLRQLRDLRAVRGVGARLGRLRPAEPLRAGQRVDHGAADHGRRAEARLGQADHRGRTLLPVRPPGQEAPGPRADLGPADRRHVQDGGGEPADVGRPARRADPGLLRRPGRPSVGPAGAGRLHRGQVRDGGDDRGLARRRPGAAGRHVERPAELPAGHHPQAARPRRGQPGRGARGGRRGRRAGSACWSTT